MNPYAAEVFTQLKNRIPWETEFLQAVEEVFISISPVLEQNPKFKSERILERIVEPERTIMFRVPWIDDRNQINVNRGFRVQFNSTLGPYKGGLRFHPSVTLGALKFLGFEQIFKNSLTGLQMGGGKGGSDFNCRGRSDMEIMRFCQSFMTELANYIGPDIDVPAGDIGVGGREIGYLYGQYKRLTHNWNGTLTGKGQEWGGSLLRPEATGYGVTYFTAEVLKRFGHDFHGKTVAMSGFGNVAWGVVQKVTELGGRVVTLSGPDGFIHDADGIVGDKVEYMLDMRLGGRDEVKMYAEKFGVPFYPGKRPWDVPCDIALPCAIQNELGLNDAKNLLKNGCKFVIEGANMPSTKEAVDFLQASKVVFAPGKAANAGGVAVSGLEMAQNHSGQKWTSEVVDEKLHAIMFNIHKICVESSEKYGHNDDYVAGANIGGFTRVAEGMIDQGVC
ncbi:MAG: glutamate dehydrogenase [Deltaproteobacteria bacterium CG2_30_63_29]|nr:MAG: glutamate dehydrogenase [Deltaproteobacteria bacterium CG2_30_63_29]PJB38393.1 MAG: NADP-specific glutamate dehydrogenase [Deltaproteobacteria bacterium CG_4_9_14_3_um_filter_63_12]